jgi:hypothetical protein
MVRVITAGMLLLLLPLIGFWVYWQGQHYEESKLVLVPSPVAPGVPPSNPGKTGTQSPLAAKSPASVTTAPKPTAQMDLEPHLPAGMVSAPALDLSPKLDPSLSPDIAPSNPAGPGTTPAHLEFTAWSGRFRANPLPVTVPLPPARPGSTPTLTRHEAVREFNRETLWDYIDGGADVYLNLNFQKVYTAEYTPTPSGTNLIVDIYDMGGDDFARQIYAREKGPESEALSGIGTEAYRAPSICIFRLKDFYVKLTAFADQAIDRQNLLGLARFVVEAL